jgi:hypothetical protein
LDENFKEKCNALFAFKNFKNKLEKETKTNKKMLGSNIGEECNNNKFLKYCHNSGVRRQFS